jgi:hypothetical protein
MAVVWAGLESVLSTATGGPHVADIAAWPVQDAATTPAGVAARSSGAPVPPSSAAPSRTRTKGASATPAKPSTSPSAPAADTGSASAGVQRRYSTPGGTVVLTLFAKNATLDTATPAPGFTVQSWTNDGFLEVEFAPSDASTVYEVIATWNGTSPVVQTVTAGS